MGEKGLMEEDLEWQKQLEEEDIITVKWAQEDVEIVYNLLDDDDDDFPAFSDLADLRYWGPLNFRFSSPL